MKIFNFIILSLLTACEFRPPSYEFQDYPLNESHCFFPVAEVHNYDLNNNSTITECYYTSSKKIKEEIIFDAYSTEIIGMITYEYKYTYYLKTIYDYVNGSQDSHYITSTHYISTESI